MTNPDELIVDKLRQNNGVVLQELYSKNYPMVRNLVMLNCGTEQEAKDIYQETVLAFYERVHQAGFKLTCRISTYLYAVGRRLWLKQLAEKRRHAVNIAAMETFDNIDAEMDQVENNDLNFSKMETAMEGLGEPCRTLLEDFYINESPLEELTAKFGYSNTDSAKNQKYKCLQRLKGLFFTTKKKNE